MAGKEEGVKRRTATGLGSNGTENTEDGGKRRVSGLSEMLSCCMTFWSVQIVGNNVSGHFREFEWVHEHGVGGRSEGCAGGRKMVAVECGYHTRGWRELLIAS